MRLRRFRRQHGGIPQRRHGAGRRREPHRRLLRGQRRPLRLAGAVRRPVQAGVLGRAWLGAARRRGADVHRRGERVPVQHHRETRSARARSADGKQAGRRGECRLHADEACGRHSHIPWRAVDLRHARAVPGRAIRRSRRRTTRPSVRKDPRRPRASRCRAGLGQLRLQRRDGRPVRARHRRQARRVHRATRRAVHPDGSGSSRFTSRTTPRT